MYIIVSGTPIITIIPVTPTEVISMYPDICFDNPEIEKRLMTVSVIKKKKHTFLSFGDPPPKKKHVVCIRRIKYVCIYIYTLCKKIYIYIWCIYIYIHVYMV